MEYKKALEIFSLESIEVETTSTLKDKYRKLMKKYHPDNMRGDETLAKEVSLAYEVLSQTLLNIEEVKKLSTNRREQVVVVTLSDLDKIYQGKEIQVVLSGEQVKVNKAQLLREYVLVLIELEIYVNGVPTKYSVIKEKDVYNNYEVHCDIVVNDISEEEGIGLRICGLEKSFKMRSQSAKYVMSLSDNIKLNIVINKKLQSSSK